MDTIVGQAETRYDPASAIRVAIAEDDDEIRLALAEILAKDGFEVTYVPDGQALVEHLEASRASGDGPDVVVMDHRMPGRSGLEILQAIRAGGWGVPVIVMTAYGSEVTRAARALGAYAVFEKPFDPDDLRTLVYCCVDRLRPAGQEKRESVPPPGAPICPACGSTYRVRLDDRHAGVYFCADCWERAQPPRPDEDVGVGD